MKFTLTLFSQTFRESNVFTKEVSRELISQNIFSVRVNFSFFHSVSNLLFLALKIQFVWALCFCCICSGLFWACLLYGLQRFFLHSVEILRFFCHSDITWNQRRQMFGLKTHYFDSFWHLEFTCKIWVVTKFMNFHTVPNLLQSINFRFKCFHEKIALILVRTELKID